MNSPEGALALSKTMSSCMDTGGMSAEKQVNVDNFLLLVYNGQLLQRPIT